MKVQYVRESIQLNVIKYDQVVIFLKQIVRSQPIKKDGNEKLIIDDNTTLSDIADHVARIETSLDKIIMQCLTENVDALSFDVDDRTCKKHNLVQTEEKRDLEKRHRPFAIGVALGTIIGVVAGMLGTLLVIKKTNSR
jgi:hypothetical protein